MRNYNHIPSLRCLQIFEVLAQSGNVATAAEILGVSASAVSHQLAKLERLLGCQLFERTPVGLQLNASGNTYLQEVGRHLQGLTQASGKLLDAAAKRTLRIHCAPSLGLLWLLPRMDIFRKQHPDIEVMLACSHEDIIFRRDNIDIAIRHGYPVWEACSIRTIYNEKLTVMGAPQYLHEHPVSTPEEISHHSLILSETTLLKWPDWFRMHNFSPSLSPWAFSFDRSYMSLEAAALGHGLVLESELLAERYLRKGSLIRVFDAEYSHNVGAHHIVTPVGYHKQPRIRIFTEWLEGQLRLTQELQSDTNNLALAGD